MFSRRRFPFAVAIAVAGVVLTGSAFSVSGRPSPASASEAARAHPAAPACRPAPLEARAAEVLIVGLPDTHSPDDPLAQLIPRLGAGGVVILARNVSSSEQVQTLIAALRQRRGAPLLVATDEEGGRVSSFDDALPSSAALPSARGTADWTPAELGRRTSDVARQLHALGVTVDFAPVADEDSGPDDGPIGDRSFSPDPATASSRVLAAARGLASGGLLPVVKHFPGLGHAGADTHAVLATVSQSAADLVSQDLAPFAAAIEAGVPAVMVGHAAYPSLADPDEPASLSPAIYQLLRTMGFSGVAITDSIGMGAVNQRADYPQAAVQAVAAGADGVLATDGTQFLRMRDALVAAVRGGALPEARLNEAAARVAALAGADPHPLTCLDVHLPQLH